MRHRSLVYAAIAAALALPAVALASYAINIGEGGGCWMSAVGGLFGCG